MRSTAWANGPQVIDVGKQAVELYSALGDADAVGRLSDLVGWRMLWWDRGEESAELVRAALDALPDVPSARRARLLSTLGLGLRLKVDKGGFESIQRGLEEAEGLGDDGAVFQARTALQFWHHMHGQYAESIRVADETLLMMEDSSDQSMRSQILGVRSMWLPFVGRMKEAPAAAQQAQALARERGDIGAELAGFCGELFVALMRSGDGRQLENLGREGAERFPEAGPWPEYLRAHAGIGLFWQGDLPEALRLLDQAADTVKEEAFQSYPRAWRFKVAAYAGRADAFDRFETLRPELFRPGIAAWPGSVPALHSAIEGLAVLGQLELAASLYLDATESLKLETVAWVDGLFACSTGIAAACGEEWEAAEEYFGTALRQADELPHVMAQYDTRRWWAWMLLRRDASGDRMRAGELLEEAIAGYQKLEAPLFEQIATEMLGQARG